MAKLAPPTEWCTQQNSGSCDKLPFCDGLPLFQPVPRLSYRYRRPARKQHRQFRRRQVHVRLYPQQFLPAPLPLRRLGFAARQFDTLQTRHDPYRMNRSAGQPTHHRDTFHRIILCQYLTLMCLPFSGSDDFQFIHHPENRPASASRQQ